MKSQPFSWIEAASSTQLVLVAHARQNSWRGWRRFAEIMKEILREHPKVGDFEWEY